MNKPYLSLSVAFMFLFCVQAAFAASTSITPSGNGSFIINGNGMDGVAGITLEVKYDTPSLASPTVSQGSLIAGALIAANTDTPGAIKIGIISTKPFSGSGQIVSITFATHAGDGNISVTSSMINSKGAPVAGGGTNSAKDIQTSTSDTAGLITSAGTPFSQPSTTVTTTTTTPPSASTPIYPGTVTMPTDTPAKSEPKPVDKTVVPEPRPEPEAAKPIETQPAEEKMVPEQQKPQSVKTTSFKGTIDSFREFKGVKSPANLIALFNKEIAANIRQEPAIVLSDGKTRVKIKVKIETTADKSPNFALNGANMVSLKKDDTSSAWIIEALPQAGTEQAHLTILTDTEIIKYPFTLAPPVKEITAVEAAFTAFLTDSKRDLNRDGKHDYQDDFIYTANYLVKKGAADKTKK